MTQEQRSDIAPSPSSQPAERHQIRSLILCPFPGDRNPHEQEGARITNAWYLRVFGKTEFAIRVMDTHMEQMTSGFYPQASLQQITLANQLLVWAFSLDDLADETDEGRATQRLAVRFGEIHEVMLGRAPDPSRPLEIGISDIMAGVRSFMNEFEEQTFIQGMLAYFGGMLWEANNRACGWTPDEHCYQMLRPAAGAVPPFFALIGPLNEARLSTTQRERAELREVTNLAGRLVCWHNDLLSHEKEREMGDVHNLAMVLEKSRGMGEQEALAAGVAFANDEMRRFTKLTAHLRAAADPAVDAYLATLESMIAITIDWTYRSLRYFAKEAASDQEVMTA